MEGVRPTNRLCCWASLLISSRGGKGLEIEVVRERRKEINCRVKKALNGHKSVGIIIVIELYLNQSLILGMPYVQCPQCITNNLSSVLSQRMHVEVGRRYQPGYFQ